jgi:formylglycine-generating enzyme required for sulfatase activity
VGSAAANNYFGTADMAGNVFEWNDSVNFDSFRGRRGGSFDNLVSGLPASSRSLGFPDDENYSIGFRVASVPEPTSLLLTMLAGGLMLIRRKR